MVLKIRISIVLMFVLGLIGLPHPCHAHTVFKKFMQAKYKNLSIKCEGCHVKGKPKTERNPFGELFHKQLEKLDLSNKWKELKGEEKRNFEKETMVPAFEKAWEEVQKLSNDQGKKYAEVLPAGEMPNMLIKKDDAEDEEEDEDDSDGGGGQPAMACVIRQEVPTRSYRA